MKRQIQGLNRSTIEAEIADGLYLVRIQAASYRWYKQKPSYEVRFYVLEPSSLEGAAITARLQCSTKTLWKVAWFLRDFRYSQELLERDEIEVSALVGLEGVVQVANERVSGRSEMRLKAFAPAADWEHLALAPALHPDVA